LQAQGAHTAGDPLGVRVAAEEGRDLADPIGDGLNSRVGRFRFAVDLVARPVTTGGGMSDLDVTASLPEALAARLKEFTNFLHRHSCKTT
jgi:hypothetical protein